ncbi:MAG TPA: MarR family transcriptional regulator [Candidatus Corynebacterium gallistercoris]|uniref:MarR family transcriptional regulator n=1 Tax=Candidatus Corynebacterium gallistercoris TaxID=2838530 RepID=A0A9D1UPL5_9CORY|nr:MarR family transcriptional regulator [Candidatus Corynebacterium gallistercoris]
MASTPLEIAKKLRPSLTRLYLLYFRQAENSAISMAQMSIMMILDEKGPMRISQIASTEAIRMPTASNAVNQLETMGLVTRVRDISDRRGVRVDLTRKGRAELEALGNERAQQLAGLIEGLSEQELESVESAVPLLQAILESYTESIEAKINADREGSGH